MTEPKFCVGDRVVIREEIREVDFYDDVPIVYQMAKKAGCEATIATVRDGTGWQHTWVYTLDILPEFVWPASALCFVEDIPENAVASENELAAFLAT